MLEAPDDRDAAHALADELERWFAYAIHEVPSGLLDDPDELLAWLDVWVRTCPDARREANAAFEATCRRWFTAERAWRASDRSTPLASVFDPGVRSPHPWRGGLYDRGVRLRAFAASLPGASQRIVRADPLLVATSMGDRRFAVFGERTVTVRIVGFDWALWPARVRLRPKGWVEVDLALDGPDEALLQTWIEQAARVDPTAT